MEISTSKQRLSKVSDVMCVRLRITNKNYIPLVQSCSLPALSKLDKLTLLVASIPPMPTNSSKAIGLVWSILRSSSISKFVVKYWRSTTLMLQLLFSNAYWYPGVQSTVVYQINYHTLQAVHDGLLTCMDMRRGGNFIFPLITLLSTA